MIPHAVFDCMVFLQGAARPNGPAAACLRLIDEGKVVLCLNPEILAELRDVLTRPKTLKKFPLLTIEWVADFVNNLELKALLVRDVPKAITLERDPKDECYVNLAIAVSAPYLVSRDKDLLDLMNNWTFRSAYSSLAILTPDDFLKYLIADERWNRPSAEELKAYHEFLQAGIKKMPDSGNENPSSK